jgi:hypothetical protein
MIYHNSSVDPGLGLREGVPTMSTLTRRQLLASAILAGAGATVVGELGRFDPARADTAPDVDPNFLLGQVVSYDSSTGVLQVADLDSNVRTAQLTSSSQVWKQGQWNSEPLAVNDCVMSRGTLTGQNTLEIGQLWVDIRNFRGQLTSVDSSSVTVSLPSGGSVTATVTSQTQVSVAGQTNTGTTQGLAPGQYVNVVGYGDPSSATEIATLIIGPTADSGLDTDPTVSSGTDCTTTTYKHSASWFWCGNVSSACGTDCAGSGNGACGDCRADKLHMAWPNLITTNCNVTCGCGGNCCRTIHGLYCGATVHLHNPCRDTSVTAYVKDCGPCVHCVAPPCDNYAAVTFDLTPCTFTALGAPLSQGVQACSATACVW